MPFFSRLWEAGKKKILMYSQSFLENNYKCIKFWSPANKKSVCELTSNKFQIVIELRTCQQL